MLRNMEPTPNASVINPYESAKNPFELTINPYKFLPNIDRFFASPYYFFFMRNGFLWRPILSHTDMVSKQPNKQLLRMQPA